MGLRKKDDVNDDADSVVSSNGSVSAARSLSKRSRQSLNKSLSNENLKTSPTDLAKEFLEVIRNHRNNNGRLLCECFVRLPTKRTNQDYYNSIKQPIDIIKIQQKLKTDEYETFQQFNEDMTLLFTNAMQYYDVGSIEHNDARDLKEAYEAEKAKKFPSPPTNETEESSRTTTKRTIKKEITTPSKLEDMDVDEFESDEDGDSKSDVAVKKRNNKATASPVKKAAGRRRTMDALNTSVNSDNSESTATGTRSRQSRQAIQPAVSSGAKCPNLDVYLEDYFDGFCSHQDATQRYLANVFYLLPEAKDYPDYYEIITNPMDLKTIAKKILNTEYTSLKQMETDLILILDNAKRYNEPKSIIYKDACKLRTLVRDLSKQLTTLSSQAKFLTTEKNREKKQKLIQDIASTNHEEFQQLLIKNFEQSNKKTEVIKEEMHADEEDDEEDDDTDEDEADETGANKEVREKRPKAKSIDPASKSLMKSMWSVFDYIKDFIHMKRPLIDPFVKLPSKVLYPDYYEDIKKPMALNGIKRKLNKRLYQTAREFFQDFELIFKNAMTYNVEESLIYKDAQLLLEQLNLKRKEISPVLDSVLVTNSPKSLTPSKLKLKRNALSIDTPAIAIKPPDLNAPLPKFTDLKEKLTYLYNFIRDYQHEGRDLAPPFLLLPSKLDYPDYYSVIKKPIDMTKILNKINHHKVTEAYTNVDEMCLDFAQMFENACTYNEPVSTLYKDALNLQRALFIKRDQIYQSNMPTDSTAAFSKDPVNDFQAEINFIKTNGFITNDYIANAVQSLLEYLFEQCMLFQDMEGHTFSDSFLGLYDAFDKSQQQGNFLTFNMVKQRLQQRFYKRVDVFQNDMFQVFNQVRVNNNGSEQVNRYSQLFRDAYDLQRYFIQKRDEVCSNGELLQTNALSFKYSTLEQYLVAVTGLTASYNYDEAELLQVNERFRPLENWMNESTETATKNKNCQIGSFYYLDRSLVKQNLLKKGYKFADNNENAKPLIGCLLAENKTRTRFIFQIYLQKHDLEFMDKVAVNTRRHFDREVFKSDLYVGIDHTSEFKECIVVGLKEFIANEHVISNEGPIKFTNSDIFVCESMYSTVFKLFRKIFAKKWSPLAFILPHVNVPTLPDCISLVKRSLPLLIKRQFLDSSYVDALMARVDAKLVNSRFEDIECSTVVNTKTLAAADEDYEIQNNEEDAEIMKKATYYEQMMDKDGELYKLGDYVYARNVSEEENGKDKPPMIVRIDRMWSINETNAAGESLPEYFLRGALFLQPDHIKHEPTHLFYKNEVFKEISREITIRIGQVTVNRETGCRKCSVMSSKGYVSSRITEIDERDAYVCETKYSMQMKTFRKFTKGLKKHELSVKCNEDEVYFLRHELQLHKKLSPLLFNMLIDYDEEMPAYEPEPANLENQDSNDDDWSDNGEPQLHDENSSQSFISNRLIDTSFDLASPISAQMLKLKQQQLNRLGGGVSKSGKKLRVKRLKKCGYNIFSKEFRKSLRDTKSSLSFIDMSKEVGNRWRALSEAQRADYEEKARRLTIIEAQKMVAEEKEQAAKAAAEAAKQVQNPIVQNSPGGFISQQVLSPQTNGQTIQMINNQVYLNPNTSIINTNGSQQMIYINQAQPAGTTTNRPVQQIAYQQPGQYVITNPGESTQARQENIGPKQAQHKEAYIRYIANMRKQQQLHSQPASHVLQSVTIMPDWYNNLDIRSSRIKENKVAQPPNAWIENVAPGEMMQHLLSLRYNMLADAINIQKDCALDYDVPLETEENGTEFTQMETFQGL